MFLCDICGIDYTSNSHRVRHVEEQHTEEKTYNECEKCKTNILRRDIKPSAPHHGLCWWRKQSEQARTKIFILTSVGVRNLRILTFFLKPLTFLYLKIMGLTT